MKSLTKHTISGSLTEGTFCYTMEPTCCTPHISIHQPLGRFIIRGTSLVLDPQLVYGPILTILSRLDIRQWNYIVMEISLAKYDFESKRVINKMINILGNFAYLGLKTLIKWPNEAQMSAILNAENFKLPFNYVDYKKIMAISG